MLPAFDIVHGFPFPKFWKKEFWAGIQAAKKWKPEIIHTHTRFFLSSFLGGIFSKWYHIPWIHIEHGSGFVVSGNRIIEYGSKLYDHTIGKWTLRWADMIITVSKACEDFVRESFGVKKVQTIYRGITRVSPKTSRSETEIHIGFVGRLVDLK